LSAVSILSRFEKLDYNILWITRTTLKKDIQKALEMIPLKKHLLTLSYKQFSNINKKTGEIYRKLLAKARKLNPSTDDPLYKTVVIVDEVHKLYTKDLKAQEMHDINLIEKMIFHSYAASKENRTRIVLMSATPITADPMEMIKLLNLIITEPKYRFKLDTFKSHYLDKYGKFTKQGLITFRDRIKDLVSYIDMSKDPRKFAQIQLTNVVVPISEPTYDTDFEKRKARCEYDYKGCKKLGFDDCMNRKKACTANNNEDKKLYKNGKYQNKILEEKCKFKVG
jgi:hypothetical protein